MAIGIVMGIAIGVAIGIVIGIVMGIVTGILIGIVMGIVRIIGIVHAKRFGRFESVWGRIRKRRGWSPKARAVRE